MVVGLGVAAGACGGGSGSAPDPAAAPFVAIQPEDARLAMAAQSVKSRLGHEVNVDVDAALLKEHAAHLSLILADALETIARGIDRARADRPAAVLKTCATIATLKIELDEKNREPTVFVDPTTGVLLLRVPNGAASFATDEAVASAFVTSE
jgi:hypothetical protein